VGQAVEAAGDATGAHLAARNRSTDSVRRGHADRVDAHEAEQVMVVTSAAR
jgi:hypothetical protein